MVQLMPLPPHHLQNGSFFWYRITKTDMEKRQLTAIVVVLTPASGL